MRMDDSQPESKIYQANKWGRGYQRFVFMSSFCEHRRQSVQFCGLPSVPRRSGLNENKGGWWAEGRQHGGRERTGRQGWWVSLEGEREIGFPPAGIRGAGSDGLDLRVGLPPWGPGGWW